MVNSHAMMLHSDIRRYVKTLKRQDWERDKPSLYTGRDWKHTIPLDTGAIYLYKERLSDTIFRLVLWDGTYRSDFVPVTQGYLIHPNHSRLYRLPLKRYMEVSDKFAELTHHLR